MLTVAAAKRKVEPVIEVATKRFDVVLDGIPYVVDVERRLVMKNNVYLHSMAAAAILTRLRAAGKLEPLKKVDRS